jgi:hypothetical protein
VRGLKRLCFSLCTLRQARGPADTHAARAWRDARRRRASACAAARAAEPALCAAGVFTMRAGTPPCLAITPLSERPHRMTALLFLSCRLISQREWPELDTDAAHDMVSNSHDATRQVPRSYVCPVPLLVCRHSHHHRCARTRVVKNPAAKIYPVLGPCVLVPAYKAPALGRGQRRSSATRPLNSAASRLATNAGYGDFSPSLLASQMALFAMLIVTFTLLPFQSSALVTALSLSSPYQRARYSQVCMCACIWGPCFACMCLRGGGRGQVRTEKLC